MADCQREINGLPVLTGCPDDTELLLVMGASAPGNLSGYGLRPITTIRQCILASLKFVFLQFKIGQPGSPIIAGQTSFDVNQSNVLQDSVFFTLATELPRDPITDQLSYGVVYDPANNKFTINLLQAAQTDQLYILHYAYSI